VVQGSEEEINAASEALQSARRAQFEVDVAAWKASRVVREDNVAADRLNKQERKELPEWRVEMWRASRAARDHKVQPALPSKPSQQVVARLISLGVPDAILDNLESGQSLQKALSPVICSDVADAGVTLVVGKADLVRQWADGLARSSSVLKADTVVVASAPRTGEISTIEGVLDWRFQRMANPSIIALAMNAPSTNTRFAQRVVEASRADVVRLVVEADDIRTMELWARIAPNAVLDIVGMSRAQKPGGLLAAGMPIATIDGQTADKATLALALLEQSAR
jgi:hypothetical protein